MKIQMFDSFFSDVQISYCTYTLLNYVNCQVFLLCVPNLVGIFVDYLANLENFVANLLGNLEIVQGDLRISSDFPN